MRGHVYVCVVELLAASGTSLAGAFGDDDGDAVVCAVASASLHAFDFIVCFGLATPPGGLGVTSARHEERAAKTPWKRTNGTRVAGS